MQRDQSSADLDLSIDDVQAQMECLSMLKPSLLKAQSPSQTDLLLRERSEKLRAMFKYDDFEHYFAVAV